MDCCLFVDDYICCGIQFWFSPRSGTSAQCRHPRIAAQQHCRVQGSAQVMCADFPPKSLDSPLAWSRADSASSRPRRLLPGWASVQWSKEPVGGGQLAAAAAAASSGQQVVFKCTAAMPHYLSPYLMDWIFSSLATHIFGSQSYHLSIWNKNKDWLSMDRTRRNFYDENHEKVSWTDRAWRV